VTSERNQFRPNFGRQMAYAGSLLAVIIVAYLLTTLLMEPVEHKSEPPQARKQTTAPAKANPTPWYQQQSPPPSMITTPDLPLFPDVEDQQDARAYEEALPKETYVQPVVEKALEAVPPKPAIEPQVAALPATPELPRWRKYSVATPVSGQKPLIAIVIDDMGVDKRRSALAIDLQGPLTLSFLTYATDLEHQTQRARNRGHELMLHVSMEPGSSAVDPGPNALLTTLSDDELRRRLEWSFGRFSTYVGVNNHMGSKFTSNRKAMSIVIGEIKNRGLLFLDSRTSGRTVGAKLARKMGVPVAERNIFIDHENTIEAVHEQLKKVEQLARSKGSVIAIGHPRDVTIRALSKWLEGIEGRGFTLVPLTTLVLRHTPP
jgi:uncharacterized protein